MLRTSLDNQGTAVSDPKLLELNSNQFITAWITANTDERVIKSPRGFNNECNEDLRRTDFGKLQDLY